MREIKFRGKMRESGEWVYGYYAPIYLYERKGEVKNIYAIIDDCCIGTLEMLGCGIESGLPAKYEIYTNTLGQYTGLKDKNGKEIYEGDIVKVSDFAGKYRVGKVVWNDNACCYRIDGNLFDYGLGIYSFGDIEVIGNIYDNPQLLEEKND